MDSISALAEVTVRDSVIFNIPSYCYISISSLNLNGSQYQGKIFSEEYKMQQLRRSVCVRLCLGLIVLIIFISMASKDLRKKILLKRALLMSTELPVESFDPSAIDLTELVSQMINRTLEGDQQFFSLLSVTAHSSFALHKVSILIYNISSFWKIDPSIFPMRYCYCLNNRTNDLTDFTAVVVDFVGNTTSFFKEIFKSSSILYVSKNETDCIFICVMAGVLERDMTSLWFTESLHPIINETFYNRISTTTASPTTSTFITTVIEDLRKTTTTLQTQSSTASTPKYVLQSSSITARPLQSRCGSIAKQKEEKPTTGTQNMNHCVLELCRFFQRCLCKIIRRSQSKRSAVRRGGTSSLQNADDRSAAETADTVECKELNLPPDTM
ncbi:HERV-H LTR-associating protein 1 [Stegostoma tigrinum]|uniref:HERV-H LTR-associating protein 1 n=1 Tax=Stegostoma tigrinum TaxID=3053191 RepID=UPI002870885D|nr:HERV-H LTR-associating protein 1 [Stegostoma tigrinum]